jgi:hypothetical protein
MNRVGITYIEEVVEFAGNNGLEGTIAVLRRDTSATPRRAILMQARHEGESGVVELGQRNGIWRLSVPSSAGAVVIRRQTEDVIVEPRGWHIPFSDRQSLNAFSLTLRDDETFQCAFRDFARVVVLTLSQLEGERGLHFDVLDGVAPTGRTGRRELVSVPWLAGNRQSPEAGWAGVDVADFATYMKRCEEEAHMWEVWVHAYCLVKCGIQSGTKVRQALQPAGA